MTVEPSPPVASSNGDVAGAGSAILSSSGSIMPSTTARTVRPSSIEKPRYRPSVVGGDRKMTGKDLHDVFKTSTTDLAVITDEQVARVQRMHEMFVEGAAFSFNYNTMVLVAATLAGLGLASNSVATIIASMLVSPIMGPVVGMAYAIYIHDKKLFFVAFRTEMLSLVFCVVMGILLGCSMGWTKLAESWPTSEMSGRGTWQNLMVGLPVAFFSGLGVAVSLLDDQTSSLVGVAISASLLPPAVNCGLLIMSFVFLEKGQSGQPTTDDYYPDDGISDSEWNGIRSQFLEAAGILLLLTIANVILIIVSGMMMFRLKERLPVRKKVAWEDLGVARRIFAEKAVVMEETPDPNDEMVDTMNAEPVPANGHQAQITVMEAIEESDAFHE